MKLLLKLDIVKSINSLKIILNLFDSGFDMNFLMKNVAKDIMVKSGGFFLDFLEKTRKTNVGERSSLNNNVLIIYTINPSCLGREQPQSCH